MQRAVLVLMAKEWQQRNPYLPVSLVGGSRRTALRELEQLVRLGVLVLLGRGRGAVYVVARECPRNGPNAPGKVVPVAAAGGNPTVEDAPRKRAKWVMTGAAIQLCSDRSDRAFQIGILKVRDVRAFKNDRALPLADLRSNAD